MTTLPAPGLHYNVPFEAYQAWPAENFSKLKEMRGTASKCKYAIDHPKEMSTAMKLGSALHIATLEPGRFENMFHFCPPCDRRTKEGKDIYAAAEIAAAGKLLLREGADDEAISEVSKVKGMAAAINAHKFARLFLDCVGHNEVSALWRDEATGLMCKARYDRYVPAFAPWKDVPVIVEIKSDRNATEWAFSKTVADRYYHVQAASYCHGHSIITGKRPAHIFIVPENFPPHDVNIFMLNDEALNTGQLVYRDLLDRYADCVKSNKWPGYPEQITTLSLPKWANE